MRINKEFYIVNLWVLAFSKDNKSRLIREECVGSEGSYNKAMGSIITLKMNQLLGRVAYWRGSKDVYMRHDKINS